MHSLTKLNTVLNEAGLPLLTNINYELQNAEYEGFTANIANLSIRSRKAKRTPKKAGFFVAFWEKDNQGTNQAYSTLESPDKLIIQISEEAYSGQFIFPKKILQERGVLRTNTTSGKMAMRVYPNWCKDLNKTAQKTKNWQVPYFIDFSAKNYLEDLKTHYLHRT